MCSVSDWAAGPPLESFTNRRPMTRCVSKPSSTASFVSRIQVLNIVPPGDGSYGPRATAHDQACSGLTMRHFVHCNNWVEILCSAAYICRTHATIPPRRKLNDER